MATFTVTHEIQCDEETFWKIFVDKEFNENLYRVGLGFHDFSILEQTETDTEIRRKTSGKPKMPNLPGPLKKVIGDGFGYTELGSMNKKDRVWRYKLTPTTMADKIRQEGKVTTQPAGEGKVKRVAELVVEAKIFGIGGLLESNIEKSLRDGWDDSAKFMNKWIAEHK